MEKYLRNFHGFNDEMIWRFCCLRRKSFDPVESIIKTIKLIYEKESK